MLAYRLVAIIGFLALAVWFAYESVTAQSWSYLIAYYLAISGLTGILFTWKQAFPTPADKVLGGIQWLGLVEVFAGLLFVPIFIGLASTVIKKDLGFDAGMVLGNLVGPVTVLGAITALLATLVRRSKRR